MISILHLINLNDLMISVIFKKQKQTKNKTKQKQISKIEETNILIENPKTQNKNESRWILTFNHSKSRAKSLMLPPKKI